MKKVIIRQRKNETRAEAERRVVKTAFEHWENDPTLAGVKAVIAVMTDTKEKAFAEKRLYEWFHKTPNQQNIDCLNGKKAWFNQMIRTETNKMVGHPGFMTNTLF